MSNMNPTASVILSDKSSGSSLLQDLLVTGGGVRIANTPHMEGETLYWSKAVAVLGLTQPHMMDSRIIPMTPDTAARQLLELLNQNTNQLWRPPVDYDVIAEGWRAIARCHAPVFVEKSPHHLHSREALELMIGVGSMNLRLVGLVRHPTDTLFSMWKRWGIDPSRRQDEWVRAYRNLLWLKSRLPEVVQIVRYEDLVTDGSVAETIARHCRLPKSLDRSELRTSSIAAWKKDQAFRFRPTDDLAQLAAEFGYDDVARADGVRSAWIAQKIANGARNHVSRLRQHWR